MLRIQSSLGSISKLLGGRRSSHDADAPATGEAFFFFHIPKTAGMSIYRVLEAVFPPHEICPGWLWDQIIRIPKPELRHYRLFRGHFYGYLEPYLGRQLKKFTILRDPIERSISHYEHVCRDPGHPFHAQAQSRSLLEFCTAGDTRHLIENFQAHCLATLYLDPAHVARDMGEKELGTFQLETAIEQMLYRMRDPEWLLHAAMQSLPLFSAVGVTEEFETSLAMFCELINCPLQSPRRENVAPERTSAAQLDSATLGVLREIVKVDAALHSHARSRLLGNVATVPALS